MLPFNRFPTSSQPLNEVGKIKAFVINGVPNLPNLPNLFTQLPHARAPMCVSNQKNVGKVGKVGKPFDFAGENTPNLFLRLGRGWEDEVCNG